MSALRVWIEGVGIVAPGLNDWPSAAAVLRGEQPYAAAPTALPAPELLPAAERRRASRIVKATLAAGLQACRQAGREPASLANVFASSGGDGHNCHALCELLATGDRQISPTRFHNSVHNAASGYWSIATGATPAAQVLCAYDASFGAGLLEAMVQVEAGGQPVLLVAGDSEYPPPLHAKRPIQDTAALALVLAPAPGARPLAELRLLRRGAFADGVPTSLRDVAPGVDAALAAGVAAMPSLSGLPLLAALLGTPGQGRTVAVEYLPPQVLRVDVEPLA
ncbi:MAG: beta-ketoacyl synthase chain length factor [Ottowia sp.]|uniref:beta-ketoacyl synthase chain length factor n=1 Tax=Ottowia sp. TaxID=1898956 RepID=UPI0039E594CE